jgi:hypothetical protein
MNREPQKVIVYRSQAEQINDEFWWSEGYLTPTMAGDAVMIGVIVLVCALVGGKIYERYQFSKSRKLVLACWVIGTGAASALLCWCLTHLHITIK